jgi:hypothetical protein
MLLGCGCQCVGDSEGIPSQEEAASLSASVSQGSEPVIDGSACTSCVAGVGPTVYECTWAYSGAPQGGSYPCCAVYSGQSIFRLYRRVSDPFTVNQCCIWGSNETAGRGAIVNQQPACISSPFTPPQYFARVALYMGDPLACIPGGGIITSLKLRVYYEFRLNNLTWVEYVLPLAMRTPPYQCLTTMTLDVVKIPHKIFGSPLVKMWSASNGRDYGIGPCWSDPFSGEDPGIPDTVTIRPVAA